MRRCLVAFGAVFALALGSVSAAEVPRTAPELAVQLVNGQHLLLSQFRGKVVMIEFLHTTCPHCQHTAAVIQQLYKEFGPRGFQPVGVAFNENAALLVPDFVRQLGLTFPVGVCPQDTVLSYIQHPLGQLFYVPQMVLVDRKGIIRAQHGGKDDHFSDNLEPNLRSLIESMLKEPNSSQRARAASAKR